MHSGQGDEGSDNTYRPIPLPREPQAPSGSEPREGIVLPSKGGRWVPPSRRAEEEQQQWQEPAASEPPAQGQAWGQQQPDPYGQQQPPAAPYGPPGPGDAQATQMMAPYDPQAPGGAPYGTPYDTTGGQGYSGGYDPSFGGIPQHGAAAPVPPGHGGDAERTQLLSPYDQQAPMQAPPQVQQHEADATQMLAPYTGHSAELVSQHGDVRAPLPPEQQFNAALPPMPQAPPPGGQHQEQGYAPPMPGGSPYAIRPGAPGDNPPPHEQDGGAQATQQLPQFQENWQQGGGPQPSPQQSDDYDYLYRRDDSPQHGQVARPPSGYPQQQQPQPQPVPQHHGGGYNGPGVPGGYDGRGRDQRSRGGKKPSTPLLVGIGVVVLAAVGVGIGLATSGGSPDAQSPSASASASAGSGAAAGAGVAEQQATQLGALLRTSNSSRTSVISAVASIKACDNLSASAATLRAAAREREDLVTQLSGMTLNALPDHTDLVGQLTEAWKASAAADNDYAEWAGQTAHKGGCHKHQAKVTSAVEKGNAQSGRATVAKQKAAALWNPIAKQYGLTQRQFTQL